MHMAFPKPACVLSRVRSRPNLFPPRRLAHWGLTESFYFTGIVGSSETRLWVLRSLLSWKGTRGTYLKVLLLMLIVEDGTHLSRTL